MLERRGCLEPFRVKVAEARTKEVAIVGCARQVSTWASYRLVRIDEVENGYVSGYQVIEGNPADTMAWMPALEQHQACFG